MVSQRAVTGGRAFVAGPNEQWRRQRALDGAIAVRLRRALADRSRETLAVALGVDVATIDAYLAGQLHIPSEHVLSLAKLLGVSLSQFYGEPPRAPGRRT
jgi:transcriptional regulator with XRE-family HTH domain